MRILSLGLSIALLAAGVSFVYWYHQKIIAPPVLTLNGSTYYLWPAYEITQSDVAKFAENLPVGTMYGDDCYALVSRRAEIVDWFYIPATRLCVGLEDATLNGTEAQKIINARDDSVFAECDVTTVASSGETTVRQHTCSYGGGVWVEYLKAPSNQPFFYPLAPKGAPDGASMWSKLKAYEAR